MLWFFLGWFALMILGIPISFSMIISTSAYLLFTGDVLTMIPQRMMAGSSNFTTLAIPFFMLAAQVTNVGGITDRIYDFSKAFLGHIRGSLGHVNVMASIIFAGKSGSGAADVAGLGPIEMEAQRKAGFDDDFNVGVTLSSATMAPVTPPSIPLVLYGSLAGVSVGALFMGGIIPGLMMGASLFVMVYIYAKKRNYPIYPKATWKQRWIATKKSFWALLTPAIIFFGIVIGFVTPTEAAALTIVYSMILILFVYREFNLKGFMDVVLDTVETIGTVILLMAAAGLLGWTITRAQLPQTFAVKLMSITSSPLGFLLIMNFFLLFMGLFLEGLAILVILVPIIMPMLPIVGVDPVHFGVVMVMNVTIGAITPPVGTYLFIMAKVADMPLEKVIKGTLPWTIPLIIVLFLVTIFPIFIMILPRLAGLVG